MAQESIGSDIQVVQVVVLDIVVEEKIDSVVVLVAGSCAGTRAKDSLHEDHDSQHLDCFQVAKYYS